MSSCVVAGVWVVPTSSAASDWPPPYTRVALSGAAPAVCTNAHAVTAGDASAATERAAEATDLCLGEPP